ncbi:hypothetical protein GDO81_023488 [Engystomops pustulosus]|uniref:Uncharacterized protein n=1 Tax=Engystomops pustulosus TaxID=76066 RepID=A0AAV6ZBL2_ENGPU|nr:hypothetical protein GDO81_023488 [Engystomops pustulosus]
MFHFESKLHEGAYVYKIFDAILKMGQVSTFRKYRSSSPMGLTSLINLPVIIWSVGGNRRKPTQTQREHTKSLQMLTSAARL